MPRGLLRQSNDLDIENHSHHNMAAAVAGRKTGLVLFWHHFVALPHVYPRDRAVTSSPPHPQQGSEPAKSLPSSRVQLTESPKIVSFETLARCGDEVWIENNGQIYRLRRTRQGKLILTK